MKLETYNKLKVFYTENKFDELLKHSSGVLFLKIRSIYRKEILAKFARLIKVDSNQKTKELLNAVIKSRIIKAKINKFIKDEYKINRKKRREVEDDLVSELYKIKVFDWGGLYQNNLEATIVNHYIKKIRDYDILSEKIDNEIHNSLKEYVCCSWYNHWTSILIEDIFKDHKSVLPAIGLIKNVDFFVNEIPFDLKVTYFPDGFMAERRKTMGLKPELTELKQIAKENNIKFNSKQKDKVIFDELLAKLSESHLSRAKKGIKRFHKTRQKIIKDAVENKHELIKWLYENQGERRFSSANKIFLILIDKNNLEESWKLKRNINFIKKSVRQYLNNFQKSDNLKVTFNWKNERYTSISDALFIVKKR